VAIDWRLDASTRRWRRDRHATSAAVEDLSDGGAAIVVDDARDPVEPGEEVVVGIDGTRATVLIVRRDDLPDGRHRYGVRFVRVGGGFRAALLAGRSDAPLMPGRPELSGAAAPSGPPTGPPPGPPVGPSTGPPVGPRPGRRADPGPAEPHPGGLAD
jgi:hypothetical protein